MELYTRLPYDAQSIIMRLTPHPLAVLMVESPVFRGRAAVARGLVHPAAALLKADEKWQELAAVAQGWFPEWRHRINMLYVGGLDVDILEARIDPATGFVALYLDAWETFLPRSHAERGFPLHLTLGFASDYGEGVAAQAVARINHRWAGREHELRIAHVGRGGAAALHHDEPLYQDPDIWWLHSRGHYGNGRWVRPRQLHVSL